MQPTVGRIVHYVLPQGDANAGQVRPAIIVRVWSPTNVQLQQFTDGSNDNPPTVRRLPVRDAYGNNPSVDVDMPAPALIWRTSVAYDPAETPGTWHWPPIETDPAPTP